MPRKILVADDIEDVKTIVRLLLESSGYDIVTAHDGFEAVEKAKAEKPDLIILDIMMPRLDGFEVCEKLKADPETATIPVIMCSVMSQSETRQRALDMGVVAYIPKPFDPEELRRIVAETLG